MPSRELRSSSGFTLLEILIVVTIIGVLMAVIAPTLISHLGDTKRDLAAVKVKSLSGLLDLYRIDNGSYPTTDQGLDALVSAPTSGPRPRRYPPQGYARDDEILDPWQAPLVYLAPGEVNSAGFDLCSLGPDGQPGGEGSDADICNYSLGRRASR